jgi:hypothetical protein
MASQESYEHKCHLCSKSFTRSFNLRNHLHSHSGVKPFSCTFCGQRFTRNHDRRVHVKEQHTGAEQHPCRFQLPDGVAWGCDAVFSRKASLQRHLNSDIGRNCRPPLNVHSLLQVSEEQPVDCLVPNPPVASNQVPTATSGNQGKSECSIHLNVRGLEPSLSNAQNVTKISKKMLDQSPSVRDTEVILLHIKPYFKWQLERGVGRQRKPSSTVNLLHRRYSIELKLDIRLAMFYFNDTVTRNDAWKWLNEACEVARGALLEQDRDLLMELFELFCQRSWANHPRLRLHLLNFLASLAQEVFAPGHPLAVILRLLQAEDVLINCAERSMRLMIDIIGQQTVTPPSEVSYLYKSSLVLLLKDQWRFHSALEICERMFAESGVLDGCSHKRSRAAMSRLGDLYVEEGWHGDAEKIFSEVLSLGLSKFKPTKFRPKRDDGVFWSVYCLQRKRRPSRKHNLL